MLWYKEHKIWQILWKMQNLLRENGLNHMLDILNGQNVTIFHLKSDYWQTNCYLQYQLLPTSQVTFINKIYNEGKNGKISCWIIDPNWRFMFEINFTLCYCKCPNFINMIPRLYITVSSTNPCSPKYNSSVTYFSLYSIYSAEGHFAGSSRFFQKVWHVVDT